MAGAVVPINVVEQAVLPTVKSVNCSIKEAVVEVPKLREVSLVLLIQFLVLDYQVAEQDLC